MESRMDSGLDTAINIFSKYTEEALLFEALAICILVATYCAFWILKKRQVGSIDNAVPVGVVKAYLNELIGDATNLRSQLFGLLAGSGIDVSSLANIAPAAAVTATVGASDPEFHKKMSDLEVQLNNQSSALKKMEEDKAAVEKALEAAKAGGSGGADGGEVDDLKAKLKALQEKLDEYSVIEDDLANLKRLQQENVKLKEALSGKGGSPEAVIAAAAEPAAEAAPAEEPAVEATEENFEELVDQVEESIEAAPADETPADEPAAEAAAEEPEPTAEAAAEEPEPASEAAAEEPAAEAAAEEEPAVEEPPAEEPAAEAAAEVEPAVEEPPTEEPAAAAEAAPAEAEAKKNDPPPPDDNDDLLSEFEKMLNM